MSNLTLKSERQIQTRMLATVVARLGLNDVNPGSVIDRLTQAAAQSDFGLYYQIAQVSRLADIDALTGTDLDLKAFEYGITRQAALKATGLISILRPDGFVKVTTTFYSGFPAPIVGDTTIYVNDASSVLIGSSGTLILGRGTNNEEEVSYAVAPVNNTNYFTYTLSTPLTKNHAAEESVILKQGVDQSIIAGTIVVVPATGTNPEIRFATVNDEVLLSGELEVDGVEVIAVLSGSSGNISSGAISGTSAFASPPFVGARAENTSKFTTGTDRETDDQLRDRIKNAVQSLSRGVKQAIKNAIVGLVDPVTAKRVVSANVVLPVDTVGPVKVYIDDGTGFEPTFSSQGFEVVRASSTGGEQRLQTNQFPVVKAQIENNLFEPYDLSSGITTLSYEVGTLSETIQFQASDFRFPDIASAEEVAAAINNKATLIEARTSEAGQKIVITSKVDTNENIQITGGSANSILAFPTDRKDTLNLYVDDVKLSKDGATATLDSGNSAPYNLLAIGAYPHTLVMVVDGKSANPQTATIQLVDVSDPAAVTAAEISAVINRDIAGLTAIPVNSNTKVRLESNTKLSTSSKIQVTGGFANSPSNGLNFPTTQVSGLAGDYIFNRELGLIQLQRALGINQSVTLGSQFTRGKLRASSPELYSPSTGQTLVVAVDGGADQTVTFDGTFASGATAAATAAFINLQLEGATAIVREIGSLNYLEINTNTYDPSGSIEIKSSSTANGSFGFTLDTIEASDKPNKAFQVSGNPGPYAFAENDSLVVVIDNDIVNNTFAVPMDSARSVSSAASTVLFSDSTLSAIFPNNGQLVDFFAAFTSGANTTSSDIVTVQNMGGGTARYTFGVTPGDLGNYAVGDLAKITALNDQENNVNSVITAIGMNYVEVKNANVVNASTQTGAITLSQKRTITVYSGGTGQITVGSAFSATPSNGDSFIIIPRTTQNVVDWMNNTKITSISVKADVSGVTNDTLVQIASKSEGSDGYVQITGGAANDKLNFSTSAYRGLAGYNYWTGLVKLVHKTIYGDDTDLVSFPGVGAAGVIFQILAPTVNDLAIQLNVTLREGVSIASIENEIKSAVTGYVNSLGVGDDVVIEQIRSAVIQVNGVTDVVITLPTANIAIADNELARVADKDILIG